MKVALTFTILVCLAVAASAQFDLLQCTAHDAEVDPNSACVGSRGGHFLWFSGWDETGIIQNSLVVQPGTEATFTRAPSGATTIFAQLESSINSDYKFTLSLSLDGLQIPPGFGSPSWNGAFPNSLSPKQELPNNSQCRCSDPVAGCTGLVDTNTWEFYTGALNGVLVGSGDAAGFSAQIAVFNNEVPQRGVGANAKNLNDGVSSWLVISSYSATGTYQPDASNFFTNSGAPRQGDLNIDINCRNPVPKVCPDPTSGTSAPDGLSVASSYRSPASFNQNCFNSPNSQHFMALGCSGQDFIVLNEDVSVAPFDQTAFGTFSVDGTTATLSARLQDASDPTIQYDVVAIYGDRSGPSASTDNSADGWGTTSSDYPFITPIANPPALVAPKRELNSVCYADGSVPDHQWFFYSMGLIQGTVMGVPGTPTEGAVLNLSEISANYRGQEGIGANGKNLNYGFSAWFVTSIGSQPDCAGSPGCPEFPTACAAGKGDFNVDLSDCPSGTTGCPAQCPAGPKGDKGDIGPVGPAGSGSKGDKGDAGVGGVVGDCPAGQYLTGFAADGSFNCKSCDCEAPVESCETGKPRNGDFETCQVFPWYPKYGHTTTVQGENHLDKEYGCQLKVRKGVVVQKVNGNTFSSQSLYKVNACARGKHCEVKVKDSDGLMVQQLVFEDTSADEESWGSSGSSTSSVTTGPRVSNYAARKRHRRASTQAAGSSSGGQGGYGVAASGADACEVCSGGVTQLTLQYLGTQPRVVEVTQKDGSVVFSKFIQPKDHVTFSGTYAQGSLGGQIFIKIGVNQNAVIRTDCSDPLEAGQMYGYFMVVSGYSLYGGLLCEADWGNDDCLDYDWRCLSSNVGFTADPNKDYFFILSSAHGSCQFDDICLSVEDDMTNITDNESSFLRPSTQAARGKPADYRNYRAPSSQQGAYQTETINTQAPSQAPSSVLGSGIVAVVVAALAVVGAAAFVVAKLRN